MKKKATTRLIIKGQLFNLTNIPEGFIDDTRFEKLFERLSSHLLHSPQRFQLCIDLDCLHSMINGMNHKDERIVSISLRLFAIFASIKKG